MQNFLLHTLLIRLTKKEETMKQLVENYCPVRQRTVRSETTKDKAGTLPPAAYGHGNPKAVTRVHFPADQVNITPTPSLENRSLADEECAISFVSKTIVPQLTLASEAYFDQVEEHESDSDCSHVNSTDFDSEELLNGKPVTTRSGKQVKAWIRLDV